MQRGHLLGGDRIPAEAVHDDDQDMTRTARTCGRCGVSVRARAVVGACRHQTEQNDTDGGSPHACDKNGALVACQIPTGGLLGAQPCHVFALKPSHLMIRWVASKPREDEEMGLNSVQGALHVGVVSLWFAGQVSAGVRRRMRPAYRTSWLIGMAGNFTS